MPQPPAPDERRRTRVLTLDAGWSGHGGHTFNRLLSQSLAAFGYDVTARVAEPVNAQPHPNLTVLGMEPLPGIDRRGQLLRTDGLPEDVDILVGHGRFSGAAALYLRDQRYPNARVVHVVHALTDELDRWRGDPEQATRHARTERTLISRADLVVAVGPLLADDAARMAQMSERPPPVHEMIPGVVIHAPPAWRDHQQRTSLLLLGRVDDPLKGADIAVDATRVLTDRGHSVQLTLVGADSGILGEREQKLHRRAGALVKVKPFTHDQAELAAEVRGADVVVMPSRNEGFGLVATETIGYGVPVLVSGNSGAGILLADPDRVPAELGGPLVVPMIGTESDLAERWADHLERVLNDLPAARGRALALRDHFGAHYTWAQATEALSARLDQLPPRQAQHDREEIHASRSLGAQLRDPSDAVGTYREQAAALNAEAHAQADPQRWRELAERALVYAEMAGRLDAARSGLAAGDSRTVEPGQPGPTQSEPGLATRAAEPEAPGRPGGDTPNLDEVAAKLQGAREVVEVVSQAERERAAGASATPDRHIERGEPEPGPAGG